MSRTIFFIVALLWLPVGLVLSGLLRGFGFPAGPGMWPRMALSLIVVGARGPAAGAGVPAVAAAGICPHNLGRHCGAGARDRGGIRARGTPRARGNRRLRGHLKSPGLDRGRHSAPPPVVGGRGSPYYARQTRDD